jgi:hypothetical protein
MEKFKWIVNVYEYERGYGSKVDFTKEFDTYDKAMAYRKEFNSKNTETTVPDWYMVAGEPVSKTVEIEEVVENPTVTSEPKKIESEEKTCTLTGEPENEITTENPELQVMKEDIRELRKSLDKLLAIVGGDGDS